MIARARAILALGLVACGGARAPAVVTLAPAPSAPPASRGACPADVSRAMTAPCDVGATCKYPDAVCVCRAVPYCPGGVVRLGPPPPSETVELDCMVPDCVGAAQGGACAREGLECRGPVCYSRLECKSGRWELVQLGPPP